ncbi:hypothetical protein FE257_001156 [Aspergillus nanangensis]|uniref:Zn(2)-C6 fungal-type domain-containing protein n=1 Tax=Aspergillus nanangensis TaxID=2582783 RepID=A0AAD4GWG6_ASPNN|nr:hypothetical protein FE257_001156 [Aspergillus nanangensis]
MQTIGQSSNSWTFDPEIGLFDLSRGRATTDHDQEALLSLQTTTNPIKLRPSSTALIIIDMQNFFLSPTLRRPQPGSKPTAGEQAAQVLLDTGIPAARKHGIQIVWLNWGLTEEDLERMPPNCMRNFGVYNRVPDKGIPIPASMVRVKDQSLYRGLGSDLGPIDLGHGQVVEGGRLLMRDTWNADLYPPLEKEYRAGIPGASSSTASSSVRRTAKPDVIRYKNRMSGLWGASSDLEEFLTREGITTLLFAGVNTDQCVGGTLMDAFSKGYDCILLRDGVATSSPSAASEAWEYNCMNCWGVAAPPWKKRIPKACSSCRQSKVKCDGKRPCTRCEKLNRRCVFFEIPKDPTTERMENVESEFRRLHEQLDEMRDLLHLQSQTNIGALPPVGAISQNSLPAPQTGSMPSPAQMLSAPTTLSRVPAAQSEISFESPTRSEKIHESPRPAKRKRSGFEVGVGPISDFITKGLITMEDAMSCYETSVRMRSSILLNAICTIGSQIETKSSKTSLLHSELKRWINVVIQNERLNCLESVQALLVIACYSAERSLILSFATRMALDLGLDEAFEQLTRRLAMKPIEEITDAAAAREEERVLMRKSRVWFGLLVLEHIFRVDGGKLPGIRMAGNARRCRLLLNLPSSTVLDLRLFSQVELNVMRVNINETLGTKDTLSRPDIADFVHEAKVDLDLWFDDWLRIIENSIPAEDERPSMLVALRVQKCWSEMMLHCKALRSIGVENVAAMSPVERNILLMAKASARQHLRLISVEPDFYLAKLKYAMDFVWAKCAFCFLLLLKLSRLLPEQREEHDELLEHGNRLLEELTKSGSSSSDSTGNGNVYLHILRLSIEKYGRTLQDSEIGNEDPVSGPFWEVFDAQADLQSFVPEQFVADWDFPELNLFYCPSAWLDFFGDFSLAV